MTRGETGEQGPAGVVILDDLQSCAPPELFVLALPEVEGGGLELRETERGELMLLTYTAMDLLVAACGNGQPSVRLSTDQVARVAADGDVALVAMET